jgi:hypothetical protein
MKFTEQETAAQHWRVDRRPRVAAAASSRRRRTVSHVLPLFLIVVLLVADLAVLRVGIDDLDEGYFVQQAARVIHGQVPYRDFLSLYTPGLLYVHAALFWVLGGPFVLGPRALALVARAALALLMYVLARPIVRNPLWAAVPSVYLLLGLDDAPERWEPHPGWLSTLFAVLAAWCLSHAPTTRWLGAAGLAAAASYVFKQNTGVFILGAVLVHGQLSARLPAQPQCAPGNTRDQRDPGRTGNPGNHRLNALVAPLAAFVAFTGLWLAPLLVAIHGQLAVLSGFVGAVDQAGLISPPELPVLVPLACLAGGLWLARRNPAPTEETPQPASSENPLDVKRLRWYLLAGVAIFGTQYPRMDTLHLAWSAPLLLVIGAAIVDRLKPAVASLAMLGLLALSWPTLASRVSSLTDRPLVPISTNVRFAAGLDVPQATANDLEGIVADIQQRTQPGEPIFVYPTSPLLYVLAERPNPTRFDHLNPGAATPRQIQGVIADLDTAHVRLVVVSDFWQAVWGPPGPNAPLEDWLAGRFAEVSRYGAYRVMAPRL